MYSIDLIFRVTLVESYSTNTRRNLTHRKGGRVAGEEQLELAPPIARRAAIRTRSTSSARTRAHTWHQACKQRVSTPLLRGGGLQHVVRIMGSSACRSTRLRAGLEAPANTWGGMCTMQRSMAHAQRHQGEGRSFIGDRASLWLAVAHQTAADARWFQRQWVPRGSWWRERESGRGGFAH